MTERREPVSGHDASHVCTVYQCVWSSPALDTQLPLLTHCADKCIDSFWKIFSNRLHIYLFGIKFITTLSYQQMQPWALASTDLWPLADCGCLAPLSLLSLSVQSSVCQSVVFALHIVDLIDKWGRMFSTWHVVTSHMWVDSDWEGFSVKHPEGFKAAE